MEVSYPFGYGLSYTSFEYGDMEMSQENDTIKVSVPVTNIGESAGKEIVQFYVSKDSTQIDRPEQELKAFAKTKLLGAGATDTLRVNIAVNYLRYWNENSSQWTLEPGKYIIKAGASSRDIKKSTEIKI